MDPKKLADSFNKNLPQKSRPKPTPLPRQPLQSTAGDRLSPTPKVTTPQNNDIDLGADGGNEVEPKNSGHEGGEGRESGDNHGNHDSASYSRGNDDPHNTSNGHRGGNESGNDCTFVDSPNHAGSDDDEVELDEYD